MKTKSEVKTSFQVATYIELLQTVQRNSSTIQHSGQFFETDIDIKIEYLFLSE